ncbi:MAG: PBP1A family penicillin-binding protein [Desulfotomaculaceae bacterium]|nr:PBP1A family penicillin-binding protein [Desulfotomaculaceae bacterium]
MDEKWRKVAKVIINISLLLFLATLPFIIWGYYYANQILVGFTGEEANIDVFDQNSFLFDDNNNLIYEIHGEVNRTPVPLEQVPEHVQKAFVAIEDRRFYDHHGIDLKAIFRAAFNYCKNGRITEGASTITQQMIKLYFLSPEQTLKRKIKEAAIALEFERRYSKDKILELYMNRVYFGEGAYGIQSAAKVYFNKESGALSLAEGALLAALVQAPSAYDPFLNVEGSLQRRNVVLEKMIEQKLISKEQGIEAQQKSIELTNEVKMENYNSYYIDYVISEAIAVAGGDQLFKGGLKIYTTLEPEIQNKAEEIFARNHLFPSSSVEAALAMVENSTGAIKALMGGRHYETKRGFNRATQMFRQPGSTFKPIAVYAPAFELGYRPDSIISDTPFKVGSYEPHNADGGYYGEISIRTAVQWSRNVAAVRLLNTIGVENGFEMAMKMGFELVEADRCLPLALGGLTRGVTPLQIAGAYATFSNRGIFTRPYAIKYIEDSQGRVIYRCPEGSQVMKASTAESMKDVLRTVVESGTGSRARIRGVVVFGKTGTTELPDIPVFKGLNGNKDAWFVGSTDRYTTAVWLGYDEKDMDRLHYLTSSGGSQPAEIFRLVLASVTGADDQPLARTQYVTQRVVEQQAEAQFIAPEETGDSEAMVQNEENNQNEHDKVQDEQEEIEELQESLQQYKPTREKGQNDSLKWLEPTDNQKIQVVL